MIETLIENGTNRLVLTEKHCYDGSWWTFGYAHMSDYPSMKTWCWGTPGIHRLPKNWFLV